MLKRLIKLLLLGSYLGLAGCASGPSSDAGQTPTNADVDPNILAEYQSALSLMKNGEDEQALQRLAILIKKYPNLAGTFVNLGIIYLKEQRYKDAQQVLLQATTISPANAVAHNHLGISQRGLGKFQKAEQSYLEALKLKPDYSHAHLNIGILYDLYLNELQRALDHYEKYKALSGSSDSLVEKWIVDLKRRIGKK